MLKLVYLYFTFILLPYESLTQPFYLNPAALFFLCWTLHNEIPVFTWKSFSSKPEINSIVCSSSFLLDGP